MRTKLALARPSTAHDPVRLELAQPLRGYRFNVDSLHLIEFVARSSVTRAPATVCDLGAGCGVVGLGVLALGLAQRGLFVEQDRELAEHCRDNLAHHALPGEVWHGDVAELPREHRAHLVVCNPPYFTADAGHHPRDPMRARARVGSLASFVQTAASLLGQQGRACFVYPAATMPYLFHCLALAGLHPKRLCLVYAKPTLMARVVLVEAKPGRTGGLMVEPARFDLAEASTSTM